MNVAQEGDIEREESSTRPLQTWYDPAHEHFVALLNQPYRIGALEDELMLTLQTLTIPQWNPSYSAMAESNSTTDYIGEELIVSSPLYVSVPPTTFPKDEGDDMLIPLLIKFSLDKNLLAIQVSPTLVRVVQLNLQQDPLNHKAVKKKIFQNQNKHWTIDLSTSTKATTAAEKLRKRSWKAKVGKNYNCEIQSITTSNNVVSEIILSVIWSDHCGNSQDLIILTSSAVRFYKVSIKRNQLAKTRKYDYASDCFWYEPTLRVLMVGQSIAIEDNDTRVSNAEDVTDGGLSQESPILFWTTPTESPVPSTGDAATTKRTGIICQTFFLHHCPLPPSSPPSFTYNNPSDPLPSSPRRYVYDASSVSLVPSSPPYKFQLELPPPVQLPQFVLWNDTVAEISCVTESLQTEPAQADSNLSALVSVANLYGDAYCVQVGNHVVKVFHLEKAQKLITLVRQYQYSLTMNAVGHIDAAKQQRRPVVSTVDNVLCIHDSYQEATYFYDIAEHPEDDLPFFIGDSTSFLPCRLMPSRSSSNIYNEGFSFIFPNFLLHCDGNFFRLMLDLSVFLEKKNDTSILKFLLRRRLETSHRLLLRHLLQCIQILTDELHSEEERAKARSCIKVWIETIALAYADAPEVISVWDYESSLPLIHKTLFFSEVYFNSSTVASFSVECQTPPLIFSSAITQTELLEGVFFPITSEFILAERSASSSDFVDKYCKRIQNLADVALLFVEAFSTHSIIPCPSLLSFVISLKFNVNDEKTLDVLLHSYLTSDSINLIARKIKKYCGNTRNGYQVVRQGTGELAETIISIANNGIERGIVSAGEVISKKYLDDDFFTDKRFRHKCRYILITYALDMMCSVALYTVAAKHILQMGRVMDAISLCLMELETPYPFQVVRQSASSIPGIRAVDFFVACKDEAQRINDLDLRIRLFYHLHHFLMRWDKESLLSPATQDSISINTTSTSHSHKQLSSEGSVDKTISNMPKNISALAEDYPEFPDYLFLQSEDPTYCSKIRQLFGYPELLYNEA